MMDRPKIMGVYGIHCTATGKWYIGASVNVHRRIMHHFCRVRFDLFQLEHGSGLPICNGDFGRDFVAYGADAFEWFCVEVFEKSHLFILEGVLTKAFDSVDNGYNCQQPARHTGWY